MEQYENDVERYLAEIGQLLPGSETEKERFLERIDESIMQYEAEANVEADYNGLVRYFGPPETIAKAYAYAWEGELTDMQTAVAVHSSWKTVVFWICVILLLACVAWFSYDILRALFAHAADYGVTANT